MSAESASLPGASASDAPVCARCAAAGPTCCSLPPGQEEVCFPVSEMERARIVEADGLAVGGFVHQANTEAFLAQMGRLFPRDRKILSTIFPPGGDHLRLAVDPKGNCVFLRADGCRLPRDARPYYCRLFPFWLSGGTVTAFAATGCLVHREGRAVSRMLALLAYGEAGVRELHGRLRLAWGLPPKEGMPRVTPSPARHRP